jgi:hypothetical protein
MRPPVIAAPLQFLDHGGSISCSQCPNSTWPGVTARSVGLNVGGVQPNLARLSHCVDLAPNRAPSASATFPANALSVEARHDSLTISACCRQHRGNHKDC